MNQRENQEFELLGQKIRFKAQNELGVDARDVVERVRKEIFDISETSKNLDDKQAATLVALKLAAENLALEAEHKHHIKRLQSTAASALNLIEEVSPQVLS